MTLEMRAVWDHFWQQLGPRNKGLIGIVGDETASMIAVMLGKEHSFMTIEFGNTTITIKTLCPDLITACIPNHPAIRNNVVPFCKNEKHRRREIQDLAKNRKIFTLGNHYQGDEVGVMVLDLYLPDCLTKAEFYIHVIITHVKHLVTKSHWYGIRPKDGISPELTDLLAFATKQYKLKVASQTTKRKMRI